MKRVALVIFLMIFGASNMAVASVLPPELDTTIRILIVRDGGASQSVIDDSVDFLLQTWPNPIGAVTGSPITITIVNPGAALIMPMISNDPALLYSEIKTYAEATVPTFTASTRDLTAADIVMAFTDNDLVAACGAALNGTWLGSGANYVPDDSSIDGVDTRGAPDWYIGMIEDRSVCTPISTMTHELGHLLGGQHGSGGSAPLLPDGRGDWVSFAGPFGPIAFRTVMATTDDCSVCVPVRVFSSDVVFANPARQMIKTVNKTAESMANFVTALPGGGGMPFPFPGPPPPPPVCDDGVDNDGDGLVDLADPDCDDADDDDETPPPPPPAPPSCNPLNFRPTNVSARLVPGCPTKYNLTWQHACPGLPYQVLGNDGAGLYLVGSTPVRSMLIRVTGAATVVVRTCSTPFTCSSMSQPPVPVAPLPGC